MDIADIAVGEEELSSFRDTWKAEVQQQYQQQQQHSAQQAPRTSKPHARKPDPDSALPVSVAASSAAAQSSALKTSINSAGAKDAITARPATAPLKPTSTTTTATTNEATALAASALSAPPSKPPDSSLRDESPAIAAYRAGTRFERMGNLAEALKYYREAHRLDPDVEKKFRELPLRPLTDDPSANLFTYYDLATPSISTIVGTTSSQNDNNKNVDDEGSLVAQFRALNIGFSPLRPTRQSKFFLLPNELISQIIVWAILTQGQSAICPLSLVSKKMFMLCAEQGVWRTVCERVHRPEQYHHDQDSDYYHPRYRHSHYRDPPLPPLSLELPLYSNSWAEMWRLRARIRRDGVFISRINYVRQGQAIESYYAPVHLVSYFRYVRFFTNEDEHEGNPTTAAGSPPSSHCPPINRVAFWTTTLEPAAAVKILGAKDFRQKGLMLGTYELEGRRVSMDLVSVDVSPSSASHRAGGGTGGGGGGVRFCAELDVVQTRKGRMNKLVWAGYWQQKSNGQRSDIPLATLRPFMFSKVNSFPSRML
ncbi:hypothetical protein HDU86_003864 [Geranomyces michiganensis]|nr:hypothetical protein HDU86_003864 [Geranomyces michiganensis]